MKTTTSHASALAAKVAAVNTANAYANEIAPLLRAAFAPFVGQKILKVDGGLLESVKKAVPSLDRADIHQVYRERDGYSLRYTVKTCEAYGEHSCTYHETSIYVGGIDGGNRLEKLHDLDTRPTDYTAAKVIELREKAEQARQAARDAESALSPFGFYDR